MEGYKQNFFLVVVVVYVTFISPSLRYGQRIIPYLGCLIDFKPSSVGSSKSFSLQNASTRSATTAASCIPDIVTETLRLVNQPAKPYRASDGESFSFISFISIRVKSYHLYLSTILLFSKRTNQFNDILGFLFAIGRADRLLLFSF